MHDVIIVGSGASGASAARRLVEQGLTVLMLDVGNRDTHYSALIPGAPFSELRQQDADQARYFLGDNLEGIPDEGVKVGAQLTPPRQFITRHTDKWLPCSSDTFHPMQSLACGGLAAGWGAACFTFDRDECRAAGLPPDIMASYYEQAVKQVGVSASSSDDISEKAFSAHSQAQPPSSLDTGCERLYNAYRRNPAGWIRKGFCMGRTPLALLTRDHEGRKANPGFDMEFWSEVRQSVFRPAYWIEALQSQAGFTYESGSLVKKIVQGDGHLVVHGLDVESSESRQWTGRRLILCAGAIGSARIVLNSFNCYGRKTPILCNPYRYIPCVQWRMLGRHAKDERHSLSQLFAVFDEDDDRARRLAVQFYSYRSLLLFKLVKEMPLPIWAGLRLARLLQNSLVIVGVHHPDRLNEKKWMQLFEDPDGVGRAEFSWGEDESIKGSRNRVEKKLRGILKHLGCFPISSIDPGAASSIHYAGTLPWGENQVGPVKVLETGQLADLPQVYLGDSAPWTFLPSKGLTLTLIANAARIADEVARELATA